MTAMTKRLFLISLVLAGAIANTGFASFGAISYSRQTGRVGNSFDASSLNEAADIANGFCRAQDCNVVVWAENACGAFAMGKLGKSGWAVAEDALSAQALALQNCSTGILRCKVVSYFCTE